MTMRGSRWVILLLLLCLGSQSIAAVSLAGCRHPVPALGDMPSVQGGHDRVADRAIRTHAHEQSADTHGALMDCPCGCTCFDHGCVGCMAPAAVSIHRHEFPALRAAQRSVLAVSSLPAPFPSGLIRPPNPA